MKTKKRSKSIQMISTLDGFPARLKRARERLGLSQHQLAEMAKIPSSSISFFENDKREPSLNSFRKLVNALNIDPDYLLNRSNDMNRSYNNPLIKKLTTMMRSEDYDAIMHIINNIKI